MAEPLPPPTAANREELVSREVEMVTDELRRVDDRLRALAWETGSSRTHVAESWGDIALGTPRDDQADGDAVAGRVLRNKRDSLLHRLSELRQRLAGPAASEPRGRWG